MLDMNGDGFADLAASALYWGTSTVPAVGQVGIYLGNGNGTFQPQSTLATGYEPVALAIEDLNHDNVMERVAGHERGQSTGWV